MRSSGWAALVCLLGAGELPAQSGHDLERAVLPLPEALRSGATIVAYVDGSFATIRSGSNGLFCVTDKPGDDRFSVECHPEELRTLVLWRRDTSRTGDERDYALKEAVEAGTVSIPPGATSRLISGRLAKGAVTPDSVTVWSEIAVPFADSVSTGIGTDRSRRLWLHHDREWDAHIMVDYRTVAWGMLVRRR